MVDATLAKSINGFACSNGCLKRSVSLPEALAPGVNSLPMWYSTFGSITVRVN